MAMVYKALVRSIWGPSLDPLAREDNTVVLGVNCWYISGGQSGKGSKVMVTL